jgi:hypothetical protein
MIARMDGARVRDDPIEYGYQRDGSYDPSPAEIAAACRSIRRRWSDRERYCRATMMPRRSTLSRELERAPWQPQLVHVTREIAEVFRVM